LISLPDGVTRSEDLAVGGVDDKINKIFADDLA
jgi:hypothetical protein